MNPKHTIKILLCLLAAVTLFHLGIIAKIIPYEVTWGGKLNNDAEMYVFEIISILINLFLGFVLLIKGNYLKKLIPTKAVNIILWVFLFIFGLNTIGNIFAETLFEKSFSLLTLIFTYLIWTIIKKNKNLTGMYIWTGFDYLGEPTPYVWPSRSSYFGIIDLAGFPKDVYYMYQSEWTDKPVLHVFPHWNWETGKDVDIWAYYSQADEVELFLNEQSLGIKKKEGEYLDGRLAGKCIYWFSNGNKESEGEFLDDKRTGNWIYY